MALAALSLSPGCRPGVIGSSAGAGPIDAGRGVTDVDGGPADADGGVADASSGAADAGGGVTDAGGGVTDAGGACASATCAAAGATCGSLPDGCGGVLDCGGCTSPASCGGAGVANACGCAAGCTVVGPVSRLAPDGMDLEHVSAGGHPALVWNGGRWVLFWERREHTPLATWGECSFGRLALMATEIDASGRVGATREVTPLGPGTWWAGDSCDNHRRGVHAFARGDGFVVAWHERAAASGDTETVYTLVDSALVATTVRRFRSAPWSTPRIGGDAATMAIAWAIDAPVYGWSFARIRADGTRGPAREIFTVASHQIDFGGLAWNGTHFGQAFESDRERLRRCGCEWSGTGHPVEVMLTRLSPDGVPVGGDVVLSEGIEEGMWGMTGVDVTALPGGGFAAAWVGTAAGGSDVAVRLVAADGSRGPLRWVTSDLDARAESTATLVAGPDGLTVAYGHGASSAPWDIRGIRVRRLDAAGAPLGDAVDVVPDTACEPACLQAPWAGPNSGDLRLVSAGGPPGAIYLVWPSAGGQPGTSALHGALVSLR